MTNSLVSGTIAGMRTFWKWLACLWPAVLAAQIPPPVIPQGVGVNIHFVQGHERDLDMIAAAGFKFVRMDFAWETTEPSPGVYQWSAYDDLTAQLRRRGMRAIYILDYSNPACEPAGESPRHPQSVAAFARWAAAAAKHFRRDRIIWEIYNEPNGGFWKPVHNATEYTTMALATAKAIRQAVPSATVVGPALATFDWPFVQTFLESGVLKYIDAVSVHPYRGSPPESAAGDYQRLREMIDKNAPPARRGKIPILSGEWGYPSSTGSVSTDVQGEYAARQQLSNLLNGVPLSIWYDWQDDGPDPANREHNFGTVHQDLTPKPAYRQLARLTSELDGYKIARRIDDFGPKDFVLLCTKPHASVKIAAWTLAEPHAVVMPLSRPGDTGKTVLDLGPTPTYIDLGKAAPWPASTAP